MNKILVAIACLALVACQPDAPVDDGQPEAAASAPAVEMDPLAVLLEAQPAETRARYPYRHPQATLEFFGVEPGMTVVEGLPGGGWYTKILLPWLGKDGRLIGANYSLGMTKKPEWVATFTAQAQGWSGENGAQVAAFNFGTMPEDFAGTADVVLMIRALHNMARSSGEHDYLGEALADAYAALKPGGILGVVQHAARDDMSDDFADGSHGYLKKSRVIAAAEKAGFEFVGESDINANPKDQPAEDDAVWRLPPSLSTSKDDPELRASYEAIGESNRMTLKFRKPEA